MTNTPRIISQTQVKNAINTATKELGYLQEIYKEWFPSIIAKIVNKINTNMYKGIFENTESISEPAIDGLTIDYTYKVNINNNGKETLEFLLWDSTVELPLTLEQASTLK